MTGIGGLTSFYRRGDDGFAATELTRGPWDSGSQHAGPPCALLCRALDGAGELAPAQLARVSFEILRPVPIATLSVDVRVVRPGRSVELVEGALSHAGRELIRARAWRIRTEQVPVDAHAPEPAPIAGPDHARPAEFFPVPWELGYHAAMEVRFASGAFLEPGPAQAWMRMRVPLVAGEPTGPLDRLMVAADAGNGVSGPLDYRRFVFINTDLTVSLRRLPEGEWVGLDAVTYASERGIGLSDTLLRDERGMVGRGTQSLLVAERGAPSAG